ncbi:MAG TPA: right-handed parallel beta-helix repeat-containing protein [Candidatus Babeliales bacterium]|nr:right-handed parallel beta-helix repeat-containing protein [Candidatus Babeliales bacterium]
MNINYFVAIVFVCLFAIEQAGADSVAIVYDNPGYYLYGGGMTASPTDPDDSMIIINTSNVVIDMGGNIFRQDPENTVPGFKCVSIAPNLSNVTIRNGIIAGFTGNGIVVNDGCFDIVLDGLSIKGCTDAGINFIGDRSGIMDVAIRNTSVSDTIPGSSRVTAGVHAFNTTRTLITTCYFEGNELVSPDRSAGVHFENSSVFEFSNNRTIGQVGKQFAAGYMFENCTEGIIRDCLAYATNTASGDGSDVVSGFYMDTCKDIWINSSQSVSGKARGQCFGFYSQKGVGTILEKISVQSQQADQGSSGIYLSNEDGSYINNSTIRSVVSTKGNAYGIQLADNCTRCQIEENLVSNNSGERSFGIIDNANPSTSLFIRNQCFNNSINYSVTYPGFELPIINGSLSNRDPGLPSLVCGTLDNVSVSL